MTMKLSNEFENIRNEFTTAIANGESQEVQAELYGKMIDQLHDDAVKSAEVATQNIVAKTPSEAKMTARELAFFNDVAKHIPDKFEVTFPEETVDRIFEDMVEAHPLLQYIDLKNAGLFLRFIESTTDGHAVWGSLFGEIQGQLTADFDESKAVQNKLTAFVVVPKDAEKYGPSWIQSFVTTQINEAFAVALEAAFLNGDGDQKPVGLSRTLTGKVTGGKTVYDEKKPTAELTFGIDAEDDNEKATVITNELVDIHAHHSVKENGKPLAVEGQVVMVVNPSDAWEVRKQYTMRNAQGQFLTTLPFGIVIVESAHQESGKVTTFVKGRYDAYVGGGIELSKYEQTFALEDMNLYTAKQFAYGKARDEKAAAVWSLKQKTKEKA